MDGRKLSFVIPCYNSEKSIQDVVSSIIAVMNKENRYSYEIILVNDGSPDDTFDMIRKLACMNSHIIGINLSKNFGQHSALMAGYANVSGDYIVGLDDDGEHDPKDVFKLINRLEEGYDYVCADFEHRERSWMKQKGSDINNWMATILLNKPKDMTFSSYYIMRRFVVDEIVKCKNPFPYVGGLILSITRNLSSVPMEAHDRKFGSSNYNIANSLRLWLNGFTAFSVKPLRIASAMGVLIAMLGFMYGLSIIIRKIVTPDLLIGYASTMAVMLFIGGMLMMTMGLLGEYIGRIYISINKVPQYVIKDRIVLKDEVLENNDKEA